LIFKIDFDGTAIRKMAAMCGILPTHLGDDPNTIDVVAPDPCQRSTSACGERSGIAMPISTNHPPHRAGTRLKKNFEIRHF
jgi:hypothetical protein